MAGEPYAAGGIRTTVAATRAATDEQLTSHVARLVQEMRRQGTTTVEIKSGYGLTVHDEARSLAVARQFTEETTFLGAHVVPDGTDPGGVRRRWSPARCSRRARRTPAGSTCSASAGAFDADQARAVLEAGRRGRAARPAARQPARPGTRRTAGGRARPGRGRPLHLPRPTTTSPRSRDSGTIATLLPGRRVLDPPALPRRPPAARRRRPGRAGHRLQPRLLLHQLDAAVHRAGRPRDGDDAGRGGARRDARPAPPASTATTSASSPPGRRADLVLLDAPSHVHLAYRPGVPLVAGTWVGGRPV